MKIILLKDVPKVGQRYDIKDVSEGFAQNSLIPRGLAEVATPKAIAKVEALKLNDLTQRKIQDELLLKSLEKIKSIKLHLKEKANEKGHLFAGITKERLAEEIKKQEKIDVLPDSIKLSKPLKEKGEHSVHIEIMGKKAEFKVVIE
jgi:large subunit ribosomal protein L9